MLTRARAWLFDGGLRDDQVAFDGVEGRAHTYGNGGVQGDVTEGEAGDDGHFQWQQPLLEYVFQRLPVFFGALGLRVLTVHIDADGDTSNLLEQAGVKELGQHPVEAIGHLTQIFEEKDAVLEGGLERSAQCGAEQGDVAADERARNLAAAENGDCFPPVAGADAARGEGCISVRRKPCIVKSGMSFFTKSELSIGPWKVTRLDLTRKAQWSEVMSL